MRHRWLRYQLPIVIVLHQFKMNIETYLAIGNEHAITSNEAALLNNYLAKVSIERIPAHHRRRVADYLTAALLMNSVDQEIVPALEVLLHDLQKQA